MDNIIFTSNLSDCKRELVAHLLAHGMSDCCYCNKKFTAARKPKGVSRYTDIASGDSVNAWSFLLCRKCTRIAKEPNNLVHASLFKKAQSEQALLVATVKGTS